MKANLLFTPFLLLAATACSDVEKDDHHDHHHDHEVISTVELNLTSQADGSTQTVRWLDPQTTDGDGQDVDIELTNGETYDLSISALNELEADVEDITEEILDEADEHQVFFTGSVIKDGTVTFTYADEDDEGLPIGIDSTLTANAGEDDDLTGILTITLRHLALQDGKKVKREGMAEDVAEKGLDGIKGEGDNDFSIPFNVVIN
jgi:hypothetical protein